MVAIFVPLWRSRLWCQETEIYWWLYSTCVEPGHLDTKANRINILCQHYIPEVLAFPASIPPKLMKVTEHGLALLKCSGIFFVRSVTGVCVQRRYPGASLVLTRLSYISRVQKQNPNRAEVRRTAEPGYSLRFLNLSVSFNSRSR